MNMEYVYAAMMSHSVDKEISDDAVTKVLEAAGVDVDVRSREGARRLALGRRHRRSHDPGRWPHLQAGRGSPPPPPMPLPLRKRKREEEEEDAGGFEGLGSLFG